LGGLTPDCVVVVATIRALKHHGGAAKNQWNVPDVAVLSKGVSNLRKQVENVKKFGVPVVVAINKFVSDSQEEIQFLKEFCFSLNVPIALCDVWEKGGEGGIELAQMVIETIEKHPSHFQPLYSTALSIQEKMTMIAREIYGAKDVEFSPSALKQIADIEKLGLDHKPLCVAKTQYSFSDNPSLLGCPSGFTIHVQEVKISNGAGFIVILTGDIMTMPGLPKKPAYEVMDITENGEIIGLS